MKHNDKERKNEKIHRASCQHLTYKYTSFHGCTLGEMWMILGIYGAIEIPIILVSAGFLSTYLGGFFGSFLLLFLSSSILTFFVLLKLTAKKIGALRKGRPPGYLKLKIMQTLHHTVGIPIAHVTRNGHWSTRRKI